MRVMHETLYGSFGRAFLITRWSVIKEYGIFLLNVIGSENVSRKKMRASPEPPQEDTNLDEGCLARLQRAKRWARFGRARIDLTTRKFVFDVSPKYFWISEVVLGSVPN